jgi:hypothetical protein
MFDLAVPTDEERRCAGQLTRRRERDGCALSVLEVDAAVHDTGLYDRSADGSADFVRRIVGH